MKKLVVVPALFALGLSLAACGKHDTTENLGGENVVLNDETVSDNLTAPDEVTGNESAENASVGDTVNVQ